MGSEPGLLYFDYTERRRRVRFLGLVRFAVHLLELCSDLQRRPVLGLWDVESHVEPTADTETQKDEETEAVQMLLEAKENIYASVWETL